MHDSHRLIEWRHFELKREMCERERIDFDGLLCLRKAGSLNLDAIDAVGKARDSDRAIGTGGEGLVKLIALARDVERPVWNVRRRR